MEHDLMNTGFKIVKAAAFSALCFAPVISQAQPTNPWLTAPTATPAPVVVAPVVPKVMPKYLVEAPVAPFEDTRIIAATTPTPSRFAPADLGQQLAMASQQPAIMPNAFGSVSQGTQAATQIMAPSAQNPVYNTVAPNGYAAPSPYGYSGAQNGYSNGNYPSQQPYGSNGIPFGGNNSWPSFGNLPFGGSPNFGFW